MIIDGRTLEHDKTVDADVCVVGSGPAGMTVAMELENAAVQVALLEAGDVRPSDESQEFYKGDNRGLRYDLTDSRTRCWGGTSARWEGFCAPLDSDDLQGSDNGAFPAWPFAADVLRPYYEKAKYYLGLEGRSHNIEDWQSEGLPAVCFPKNSLESKLWLFKTVRFGEAYQQRLARSSLVHAFLNSSAHSVSLDKTSGRVRELAAKTLAGNTFRIRARHFVLACGGIENPRLLLYWFSRVPILSEVLGNTGRYFMEHPHYRQGATALLTGPLAVSRLYEQTSRHDLKICAFLQFSAAFRRHENLPKVAYQLRLGDILDDTGQELRGLMQKIHGFEPEQMRVAGLTAMCEQHPFAESRVKLSDECDRFGIPRVSLDWRIHPLDLEAYTRSLKLLISLFGRCRAGRVRVDDWIASGDWNSHIGWGSHHIGTTRMGERREDAVVNPDGRVFGLDNFYLSGSSVFPTAGAANPTYTIVALAVRLAEHLLGVLGRKR